MPAAAFVRTRCLSQVSIPYLSFCSLYTSLVCYSKHSRTLSWLSTVLGQGSRNKAQPPQSPAAQPEQIALGNQNLLDSFSWLSEYQRAKDYITAEQAYFQQKARQLGPLQQQLLSELRQHIKQHQAEDPPEATGQYLYSSSYTPHGTQTITRTSTSGPGQQEQVVVDDASIQQDLTQIPHLLAHQQQDAGCDVTAVKMSRDQQLVASGITTSAEVQACIVRNLQTGAVVQDLCLPAATSFEWSADGTALYYSTADESGRPCKVHCRRSGVSPAGDALLFHEPDAKHFITLTRTKDWRYILINSTSKLSSEVHLLDPHNVDAPAVCVQHRQPNLEYFVEHYEGHLLILTNHNPLSQQQQTSQQGQLPALAQQQQYHAVHEQMQAIAQFEAAQPGSTDYSLYTIPVADLQAGSTCTAHTVQRWRLLRAEGPGCAVTDMDVFDGCVVLHMLHNSTPQLTLLRLHTQHSLRVTQELEVQLPEWALWLRPGINGDYASTTFRLYASSPAHPEVPLQVDLATGTLQQLLSSAARGPNPAVLQHDTQQQPRQQQQQKQQQAGSRCTLPQPADNGLVSQRLWAPTPDGTAVPFMLLQQADQLQRGPRPLLVEVYGAYGHVLEAEFKPHRLPLLARGWSVALAHVRGGGELGRRWHAAGRQLHKHHSVTDLLAVLQHLMQQQVTAPSLIAGHAASAGCLTLAAAINAQPEWFGAAVLEAPFVDWVSGTGAVDSHGHPLVGDHLLTHHETDEWGDPWSDEAVAKLVTQLCPYTNLVPGVRYPAMLLTAGLQDTRVPWWMPVKYAAKLRHLQETSRTPSSSSSASSSKGGGPVAQGAADVLLQFDDEGSHFSMGLSGGNMQDAALQQAFLCTHVPCPALYASVV